MDKRRQRIADLIYERLHDEKLNIFNFFKEKDKAIGYFFIDDLLPEDFALEIYNSFPKLEETKKRKDLREYKYTAYEMNKYNPILEELIYAFQDSKIVSLVAEVCGLTNVYPDENLYAGGLSMMAKGNYLNPHLDNSHDKDRNRWRVLNLLYYVTPDWSIEDGGNLELWPEGVKGDPLTIASKFNRLVVMATSQKSWHSVSKVNVDAIRCCVSNYYFSSDPYFIDDKFHITSFRGRPNQKMRNLFLITDSKMRNVLRKLFKKGIRENPHQYKK